MTVTVALAGDTMLGRGVGRALATTPPEDLVAPEVRAALGEADLVVLNLECCISERGRPWDAPGKPFFFRAPPRAVELLVLLGADCVTLANNHALDYGFDALADTLDLLAGAGIAAVGAGPDLERARRPVTIPGSEGSHLGQRVRPVFGDHRLVGESPEGSRPPEGGLEPGPMLLAGRGQNRGCRMTCGSCMPFATALARRGPAVSDAVRTQHGSGPLCCEHIGQRRRERHCYKPGGHRHQLDRKVRAHPRRPLHRRQEPGGLGGSSGTRPSTSPGPSPRVAGRPPWCAPSSIWTRPDRSGT
jgi:hypothetical protein